MSLPVSESIVPTMTQPMPEWAIRMDTKLDIVLKDHTDQLSDHETRLRIQESRESVSVKAFEAVETRLRMQEDKSTVSPAALYTACLGALMAATGLAAVIIQILK